MRMLLRNAIPLAFPIDAFFSAWLALIVVNADIGAFGLFAFKLRHVTNLPTSSAVLVVITEITRRLLAFVILAYLATSAAVLILVAPIALWLFTFVVLADFVAIPAFAIFATNGRTRAAAFAPDTVLITRLAL